MFVALPTHVAANNRGSATPWANHSLIAVTILAFAVGASSRWHIGADQGWWSVLLYGFAHASPWHLMVNMLVLYVIGDPVNRRVGNGWYLGAYLGTLVLLGVIGRLFGVGPARGASGAIFCILTVFLMLFPAAYVRLVYLAVFPATLIMGVFRPPAEWIGWLLRWGAVQYRGWWCLLLIPLMESLSFFWWRHSLGIWPWTHPAHLLGMLCGVVVVLLLPPRISMGKTAT